VSRRDEVIDAAQRILQDEGLEALTMRRLGEALSMRAPSLYKHVSGKDEIEAALQQRALQSLGVALGAAGVDLASLAAAYRGWALAHPRLYELAARRPLHRDQLAPGVEADAAAPLVAAVGADPDAARALWAAAHGLVDLELAGRFPPGADVDAAWATVVRAFSGLTGS